MGLLRSSMELEDLDMAMVLELILMDMALLPLLLPMLAFLTLASPLLAILMLVFPMLVFPMLVFPTQLLVCPSLSFLLPQQSPTVWEVFPSSCLLWLLLLRPRLLLLWRWLLRSNWTVNDWVTYRTNR